MDTPIAPEHHAHKKAFDWRFATIVSFLATILILTAWPLLTSESASAPDPSQFDLLHPEIARLDVDDFLATQKKLTVSMVELRAKITPILENEPGEYGVYVEDLFSGAWMGVNERDPFIPASLMKVPLMVSVLKQVELGYLSLDEKVEVNLKNSSGTSEKRTVNELLRLTAMESNNIAANALATLVTKEDLNSAFIAFGIPLSEITSGKIDVSPKEYSNILRSLYFSTYLRRRFSQLLLSTLVDTEYNEQLVPGIPVEVKVAHKVGFWKDEGQNHDCGIVYLPEKNYLICIMSAHTSFEDASRVTTEISRTAYSFMSKEQQADRKN